MGEFFTFAVVANTVSASLAESMVLANFTQPVPTTFIHELRASFVENKALTLLSLFQTPAPKLSSIAPLAAGGSKMGTASLPLTIDELLVLSTIKDGTLDRKSVV